MKLIEMGEVNNWNYKPMDSLYRRLNTVEEDINGLGVNMRKLPRM